MFRMRWLIPALTSLTLAACGGSSSSSSNEAAVPAPPSSGKVTVLLTDGPGPAWDQAIATITSIELIGEDGNQSIFSGSSTVDLLSLPDFYDVFAIADDVVPDTFEKIRLNVDSLELVDLDETGAEIERVTTQLVGNGKIDLNPRDDFVIGPGDSLYIEIDFDMNKAFKTTITGNGKVIVRPVVMVNVTRVPPAGRLTRLHGTIENIDLDGLSFDLCQEALVSAVDDDEAESDDDGDRHCIEISTDAATGLFGMEGQPIVFDALTAGTLATAVGYLRENSDVVLAAVTVEVGDAFLRAAGTADGIVVGDLFNLALESGQELGTDAEMLATQLYPQTRIFLKDGEELGADAIVPGIGVLADAVLFDDGIDETLRAALLILDPAAAAGEEVLQGEIVSIDFDAGSLQLFTGDAARCIDAQDADIFLVSNVEGFTSERVGLGDLEPMQSADVFGDGTEEAGCFVATDVLASALPGNALPVAVAGDDVNVSVGAAVLLDGSASSDPDDDPLSHAWTLVASPEGSLAELSAADTEMPSLVPDFEGEYIVELVVNDGKENSAPDLVTITASAAGE
jgi:hypothetical protein